MRAGFPAGGVQAPPAERWRGRRHPAVQGGLAEVFGLHHAREPRGGTQQGRRVEGTGKPGWQAAVERRFLLQVGIDPAEEEGRGPSAHGLLGPRRQIERHDDDIMSHAREGVDQRIIPDAVLTVEEVADSWRDLDDLHAFPVSLRAACLASAATVSQGRREFHSGLARVSAFALWLTSPAPCAAGTGVRWKTQAFSSELLHRRRTVAGSGAIVRTAAFACPAFTRIGARRSTKYAVDRGSSLSYVSRTCRLRRRERFTVNSRKRVAPCRKPGSHFSQSF